MINQIRQKIRLACFVSAHGLGHASRLSAVLQEISNNFNSVELLIVGEIPTWFWKHNLPRNCRFELYLEIADVGLAQLGPFEHDIDLTFEQISDFIKFPTERHCTLVERIKRFKPNCIICDISPLGIKIANELDIASVLLENFTWDWIYQPFLKENQRFGEIISILQKLYFQASKRLQCIPFCKKVPHATKLNPVFRNSQGDRESLMSSLGLEERNRYILVTTGGITMKHTFKEVQQDFFLVVPSNCKHISKKNHVVDLPMNMGIPFPDLVKFASCVVGKAGYGTISECWGMNTPFLGVFRDSFRESSILRKFCQQNLVFLEISFAEFINGSWTNFLPEFMAESSLFNSNNRVNGASQASEVISNFIFP